MDRLDMACVTNENTEQCIATFFASLLVAAGLDPEHDVKFECDSLGTAFAAEFEELFPNAYATSFTITKDDIFDGMMNMGEAFMCRDPKIQYKANVYFRYVLDLLGPTL